MAIRFLSIADVLELHRLVLLLSPDELPGVHSVSALESAVAAPVNQYLYSEPDVFELAAAYADHVARGHPFLSGNKRVAAAACVTFLELNDIEFRLEEPKLADLVLGLVEGRLDSESVAQLFRQNHGQ